MQANGVAAAFITVPVLSIGTFWAIKKTVGLRVDVEAEEAGLDIAEHGMYGYPEQFIPQPEFGNGGYQPTVVGTPIALPATTTPRRRRGGRSPSRRRRGPDAMKKIEAYIRHEAFEPIRGELLTLGFPLADDLGGQGVGAPEGRHERYRGAKLTNYLRPKVKLECVVATTDVETVVGTILNTYGPARSATGRCSSCRSRRPTASARASGEETLQAHPEAAVEVAG